VLKHAERLAIKTSAYYIADSPVIKKYLDKEYNINSKYIAYGAHLDAVADEALLNQYGLQKYHYLMLMARMEPENNIEMILDGFCASNSKLPFIVVGNTSNKFGTYLEKKYKQEPRIRFLGGIFNENIVLSLTSYCSLYFHGHSVGGTNPSLLHAMAAGAPIAAHQNPFNQSILKDNSIYFSGEEDVCACIDAGHYVHAGAIDNNKMAIENDFTWDKIIGEYERYFMECYAAKYNYYPYPIEHEKSIVY
jgi:glycosyltransferase involved in cell wall biosynthesis